ncbi:MAG: hypothetical protein ACOYNN_18295 [Terrimicrobiaceae bacterium]
MLRLRTDYATARGDRGRPGSVGVSQGGGTAKKGPGSTMTEVCEHGHQARKCEVCELTAECERLREAVRVLAKEAYWSRTWEDSHFEDSETPVTILHHIACKSKDSAREVTNNNPIAAAAVRKASDAGE